MTSDNRFIATQGRGVAWPESQLQRGFQRPKHPPFLLDAVQAFAAAEKAPATRRPYKSDLAGFVRWCEAHGAKALPASPAIVASFLAASASAGTKATTLTRRMSAIRYAHRLAGMQNPAEAEPVRAVLRGIRRQTGTAPDQKAAATADRLRDMLAAIPDTMKGKRDRALLSLGMAGAFRRSELVALEVCDLMKMPEGLQVTIRQSKTDQEGRGHVIAILRGSKLRPVRAVQDWMDAAGITEGPVFRPIDRHGRVSAEALTSQSVALVVKQYADAAGLDPDEFAGHSLRRGFLTSVAESGADVLRMMEVSRHKRVETVREYAPGEPVPGAYGGGVPLKHLRDATKDFVEMTLRFPPASTPRTSSLCQSLMSRWMTPETMLRSSILRVLRLKSNRLQPP